MPQHAGRYITGGLWLAAAAAGAAGWRLPRGVYPAVLAAASVATAVTLSYELADRQGDRITDVILARLEMGDFLTELAETDTTPTGPLRVVQLG